MRYATIKDGIITSVGRHPGWLDDNGQLASAELMVSHGVYPVEEARPTHDPATEAIHERPWSDWTLHEDRVTATWSVTPIPADQIQAQRAEGIIRERERRLSEGFDYDFGDARGVHRIGTTPQDMRKWLDEVTPISQAYINAGMPAATIDILTDTGPVTVTAVEWQTVLVAAGAWRQPIYGASFVLQALDPIPADYMDDVYWAPG